MLASQLFIFNKKAHATTKHCYNYKDTGFKLKHNIIARKHTCNSNLHRPSFLFDGNKQTLETQIRYRRMRRLIRVSNVCLQNACLKLNKKKRKKNYTQQPLNQKQTGPIDKYRKHMSIMRALITSLRNRTGFLTPYIINLVKSVSMGYLLYWWPTRIMTILYQLTLLDSL